MTSMSSAMPDLVRRCRDLDVTAIEARAGDLGVDPLVVQMLAAREVGDLDLQRRYLRPQLADLRPPEAMAGFEPALELLCTARAKRWRVGVFGDYDVDGVTTAAILTTFLEAIGLEVVARVAHRETGYGLGVEDARALVDAGANLVVTGDVGTSDIEALEWLRARKIPTAVIDHHQVPEIAPPADAFINPHQGGCGFPFKGLCSAGVAFYLCAALRTRLQREGLRNPPDPRAWLDLVAVATICDMMPLRDENRILVRKGLGVLDQRRRPGLRALLELAGVERETTIDEEHVAFKLGPRLNAPGRLGSAEPALQLLRARTHAEARPLAERVEMLNARRKRHSEQTLAEAMALLVADPHLDRRAALVVAHEGWLPGVVGIAAAGLAEHFGRPALVLAIDSRTQVARGSVRSKGGIDVRAALARCEDLLERHGGHREAAGVTMPAQHVDALVEAFDSAVSEQSGATGSRAVQIVDDALPLGRVEPALVQVLGSLAPYGVGFEPPRFLGEGLRVDNVRVLKDRHLKLVLRDEHARHEAIAFGQARQGVAPGDRIDCIYWPVIDRFRGHQRLQLQIERLWKA
jgi:single-stranded-DNA-specific exonuclease